MCPFYTNLLITITETETEIFSFHVAVKEEEAEETYMNTAREQKDRVSRIRKARAAAETIQRAWRKHLQRTGRQLVSAL